MIVLLLVAMGIGALGDKWSVPVQVVSPLLLQEKKGVTLYQTTVPIFFKAPTPASLMDNPHALNSTVTTARRRRGLFDFIGKYVFLLSLSCEFR